MSTLFVDHLTVIDFSYFDVQRGVVGESWIVDVLLHGDLNEQGMVFDFGHVKKQIKQSIDQGIDHKFVVPILAEGLDITEKNDQIFIRHENQGVLTLDYKSPREAVYLVEHSSIAMSHISRLLQDQINSIMPDNVKGVEIQLRNEQIDGAYYHYSHGLKKHLGDCQRIAHGHRSAIEIYVNQQRQPLQETLLAERFKDIYIGTVEDISREFSDQGQTYWQFSYEAEQGFFSITLNQQRCHLMHSDTTVELIAQHIAQLISDEFPEQDIDIKAFEGVRKGAFGRIIN